jgi:quercetin dioxygenase-like cupin family protein
MGQRFFYYTQLPSLAVPNDLFDVRFISTNNITVAFNTLKAGAEVPVHEHIHETIDYIQEGELEMTIGDETIRMFAGMVARVPSSIPHSARAITHCKVINIFYPVREDFIASLRL